jgi:cytochrome c
MKTTILIAVAALGLAAAGTASASEALAKSSGCLTCHNVEGAKKMGASFKDIAAKNKGKADAEAAILAKMSSGKGHPAVKASAEDQKTLVKWVLAR